MDQSGQRPGNGSDERVGEQSASNGDNLTATGGGGATEVASRKPWLQRYAFSLVLFALCLALGTYLLVGQRDKGSDLPVLDVGGEFSLPDLDGNEVTLSGTNGKVRLMYFFFANCPDVCPPTTFVLSQVQDQLQQEGLFGSEVQFLSITFDPERDTPEVLKEYAERFEADPDGWEFLRGEEAATADLAKQFGSMVFKQDGEFGHANYIILIDKQGRVRDLINGNDFVDLGDGKLDPAEITAKIKSLL